MTYLALILGLFLLGVAVTMVLRALTTPAGPSTETIEQIGAYGFAGSLPASTEAGPTVGARLGDLTGTVGQWLSRRFTRLRGKDYRARLVSAGMYTTTPERLLGTQFFVAVLGAFVWLWLGALAGASAPLMLLGHHRRRPAGLDRADVRGRLSRTQTARAGRASACPT